MKKFYIVLFSLITSVSYGQFTKGTIMAGGNMGFQFDAEKTKSGSTTTVTGHTNSFFLTPQAGDFIMDNFAVGLGLDIDNSTYKENNTDYKRVSSSISLAPFARYYFQNFFGQASIQFGSGRTKITNDGGTSDNSHSIGGWSLAAGYAFLLNESVAVEPMLGYGSSSTKENDVKSITQGVFVRVGFQIYLHKK